MGNAWLLAILIPVSIFLTSIPSTILRYREREYFTRIGLLGDKSWIIPESLSNFSRYSVEKKTSLENEQLEEVYPKQKDLEPVLHETYLRYKSETSPIYPEEPDPSELYLD